MTKSVGVGGPPGEELAIRREIEHTRIHAGAVFQHLEHFDAWPKNFKKVRALMKEEAGVAGPEQGGRAAKRRRGGQLCPGGDGKQCCCGLPST